MGAEARSWQPLLSLGTRLTSLSLRACYVVALPAGLSSLSRLQVLDLSGNHRLFWGDHSGTALEPLVGLGALTQLYLEFCDLACIPSQRRLLPALRELSLVYNSSFGDQGEQLWPQLRALSSLTNLNVKGCLKGRGTLARSLT